MAAVTRLVPPCTDLAAGWGWLPVVLLRVERFAGVGRDGQDVADLDAGVGGGAVVQLDGVFGGAEAGNAGLVEGFHLADGDDLAGGVEVDDVERDERVAHPEA